MDGEVAARGRAAGQRVELIINPTSSSERAAARSSVVRKPPEIPRALLSCSLSKLRFTAFGLIFEKLGPKSGFWSSKSFVPFFIF